MDIPNWATNAALHLIDTGRVDGNRWGADCISAIIANYYATCEGNPIALEYAQLVLRVKVLMQTVGEPGTCKGCGADIFWIVTKSGKRAPYTALGLNHFADCPKASAFRRGAKDR